MASTSEEILAQYLQQQQAANRWNSPQNLINLATLGLGGISGLAGGAAAARGAEQDAMDLDYRMAQDAYQRRLAARQGLQAAILGQMDVRQQGARDLAQLSPLGAEQMFAAQMARARGLSDVAGSFQPSRPLDPGIAALTPGMPNLVGAFASQGYRDAISPEATQQSIMDRRNVLLGLQPDQRREEQLMALLNQQMEEASQPLVPGGGGQAYRDAQARRGGGGFWKTLGKIGLAAAPIIAAPFTGGASLAAIGAAAGAGQGALSGGGLRGALLGAGTGALSAGLGGGAAGSAATRGIGEGAGSAIQRAILNPRALATIGGASLPGAAGQIAGVASSFLPGARAYVGPIPGFTGPQMPALPPSGWEVDSNLLTPDMTAPTGPPQAPLRPSPRSAPSRPKLAPMRPVASHSPTPAPHTGMGANRPAVMRAPTTAERVRDFFSPALDVMRNIGMPGAAQMSTTVPYAPNPYAAGQQSAWTQQIESPIGSTMLGGLAMGGGAAASAPNSALSRDVILGTGRLSRIPGTGGPVPQLPAARPVGQLPVANPRPALGSGSMRPSLPAGQYQMPPSSVARGPYQMPASPFENEIQHAPAIYQRLIAESQKRLNAGDIAGARAIWNQMLHYGKFINK